MVIKEQKWQIFILPGAAYTEQNGYFTNLEGKLTKSLQSFLSTRRS